MTKLITWRKIKFCYFAKFHLRCGDSNTHLTGPFLVGFKPEVLGSSF